MNEIAMTVLGPVDASQLGVTLVHEHLHMDATPLLAAHGYASDARGAFDLAAAAEARWNPGVHPDNYRLTDPDLVVTELEPYRAAGGRSVVDVTPVELGRDPAALREISLRSGLHIVMGAGHYTAAVHSAELATEQATRIADRLVDEWANGVGSSGIRPGIIGEIGTSNPLHPAEARVLQGAARASRSTGLAVSVHLEPWGLGADAVLDVLLREGMRPGRIVLGHMTTAYDDRSYLERLLAHGVYLAFDLFGFDHSLLGLGRYPPSDAAVIRTIVSLIEHGHGGRILLSQDVGVRTRLRRYAGWGYAHLLHHVIPLLRAHGLEDAAVRQLMVGSPRTVLTVQAGP